MPVPNESVFLNVPFDRAYSKLFQALIFAVHACGFRARCALETDDGSQLRLIKLYEIIRASPLGIHDLSRTTLDHVNKLPRFNMPLELGLFLGAKRYGDRQQRRKSCLILERVPYASQKYCSDLAGQDIRAHRNSVEQAITATRNWLRASRRSRSMPHGASIAKHYVQFRTDLPRMCKQEKVRLKELHFVDYQRFAHGWLHAD